MKTKPPPPPPPLFLLKRNWLFTLLLKHFNFSPVDAAAVVPCLKAPISLCLLLLLLRLFHFSCGKNFKIARVTEYSTFTLSLFPFLHTELA